MDNDGWIPFSLIASFHRVQALTQNVPLIIAVSLIMLILLFLTLVLFLGVDLA